MKEPISTLLSTPSKTRHQSQVIMALIKALEYLKKIADAVLNVLMRQYKDYLSLSEEELKALHEKNRFHIHHYILYKMYIVYKG